MLPVILALPYVPAVLEILPAQVSLQVRAVQLDLPFPLHPVRPRHLGYRVCPKTLEDLEDLVHPVALEVLLVQVDLLVQMSPVHPG